MLNTGKNLTCELDLVPGKFLVASNRHRDLIRRALDLHQNISAIIRCLELVLHILERKLGAGAGLRRINSHDMKVLVTIKFYRAAEGMVATRFCLVDDNFVKGTRGATLHQSNIAHAGEAIPVNSLDLINPPDPTGVEVANDRDRSFNPFDLFEQIDVLSAQAGSG